MPCPDGSPCRGQAKPCGPCAEEAKQARKQREELRRRLRGGTSIKVIIDPRRRQADTAGEGKG